MTQEEKIDHIFNKVDKIDRGLYGDTENKVPGLMQKHYSLKEKVERLEDHRKKAVYYGSGLFVGLQFAWFFIKDKFNL